MIQKLAHFNYTHYKIKALQCTYPNSRLQVQYQVRLYRALWSNIRYQVLGYSSRNYDDLSLLLWSLSLEYLEVMCLNNNTNVCKFGIAREHWPGTLEYIIPMAGWWKKVSYIMVLLQDYYQIAVLLNSPLLCLHATLIIQFSSPGKLFKSVRSKLPHYMSFNASFIMKMSFAYQ